MAIKHAFTNPKSDGGDATIVRPSNWNDNHVIDAATITLAQIVNVSTTQRVIGRNTAGAGVQQEVTASQIFDWVASTDGSILTRTGGAWGAIANWKTDNGDLVAAENASPVTPAAGTVKLFGSSSAGRQMLATLGPLGGRSLLQPLIGSKSIALVQGVPAVASLAVYGVSLANTGTVTARGVTTTNKFTGTRRTGIVTASAVGAVAGTRHAAGFMWRGNTGGAGGFHVIYQFGISDATLVGTANMFIGVMASTAAPTDVDPASLTNLIGVGCTNGDTQMQLYAADGTARAKTALGASFPCNTVSTDIYEFALYAVSNGSDVRYQLTRINTGDTVSGTISASANLPSSTTLLTFQAWRSNGGVASPVGLDLSSIYIESD